MKWELKTFTPEVTAAWNQFIKTSPQGSIHQTTAWRNFQVQIPGREQVLGFYALDENQKWIGATWCVKMSTGFLNTHWYYSARGPVFALEDPEFCTTFLNFIQNHLKAQHGLFWRLDPYWQNADWEKISQNNLLNLKPATKNFQPTDSLLLDLRLSEEALLEQMHRQGRKALRLAEDAGVNVTILEPSQIQSSDLKIWQELNEDTTARDGFYGHDKTYYEKFIQTLAPYTYLCLAKQQEKPIAAAILTVCDTKAIYYFGASSSDPTTRDLRAPYALQWAMIKKAQSLGAKTYDFTGITPADQPDHPYKGITQFKTRFGGCRDTYAAGKEIVLRAWWYKLYRIVKKIRS